jgi:hypothetical protein
MPWSPVPKFPDIVKNIKANGFNGDYNFSTLEKAIIDATGVIRADTIKRIADVMVKLGFIGVNGNGTFKSLK